jgi:hypothetical protein
MAIIAFPASSIINVPSSGIIGRISGGVGQAEVLTINQAKNLLGLNSADSPTFSSLTISSGTIVLNGVTLNFPQDSGQSGYLLTTDGSGNLNWSNASLLTGATGPVGATGLTGATGVAGSNGTNGATGATGVAGSNGPNGATGATGVAGSNGTNGATGATGVVGSNGANGATGATGVAGSNGANGATGATGLTGATGNVTGLLSFSTSQSLTLSELRQVKYNQLVGSAPVLTYNGSDQLTGINYSDGSTKAFTYSGDLITQIDYVYGSPSKTYRKVLSYSGDLLVSIVESLI